MGADASAVLERDLMGLDMMKRRDVWALALGLTGLVLLSLEQALGFF